jgi:hypothetical protein
VLRVPRQSESPQALSSFYLRCHEDLRYTSWRPVTQWSLIRARWFPQSSTKMRCVFQSLKFVAGHGPSSIQWKETLTAAELQIHHILDHIGVNSTSYCKSPLRPWRSCISQIWQGCGIYTSVFIEPNRTSKVLCLQKMYLHLGVGDITPVKG